MKSFGFYLFLALCAFAYWFWNRLAGPKAKIERKLDKLIENAEDGDTIEIELGELPQRHPLSLFAKGSAEDKSGALNDATVSVHSVTSHSKFVDASPHDESHTLIVVEATFEDYEPGFDIENVELIDGESDSAQSYGDESYQVFLNPDGTMHPKQGYRGHEFWESHTSGSPIRVCLVFSAPKEVRTIGLGYWGNIVVDRPYDVEPSDTDSPPTSRATPR